MIRSANCYVLYIHITVVFMDTSNVEMEIDIAKSLPPLQCCTIFPNLQGFHMESKICSWLVHFFQTISPLQP